jgi:DNA-binding XRE family transcriptional regulator
MPKKSLPPFFELPPLSSSALVKVEHIEEYALQRLRGCSGAGQFNFEKAVAILRTCVLEIVDIKIKHYSTLPNYRKLWLIDIKDATVSSATGLLADTLANQNTQTAISMILSLTINDHLDSTINDQMERQTGSPAPKEITPSASDDVEPISKQIDDLRNECRWTKEELAELVGLSVRSIYKHISGEQYPRSRHVAEYEKKFSEKLDKIVHLNTSGKRQTPSKRQVKFR